MAVREIRLSRGMVALVDEEDYERVAQFRWSADVIGGKCYAVRWQRREDGTKAKVYMHRLLMDAPKGTEVDHRDGDGRNNTRGNMRLATHAENGRNRSADRDSSTGIKGISWDKDARKWQAGIGVNGKRIALGRFDTPEAAHAAYAEASKRYHGEFGRTQ